jgi:pSer/pThr/pTyr-binding forkhead associated (FHA) protein
MKVITIGRSHENDITINDERVSRNHLQIVQDNNGNVSAVDLGSTNGTFVNEQRITGTVQLQPNDTVKIGNTALPWQTYFMAKQPQQQLVQQSINQSIPVIDPPKPKRTVWYIAASVAVLLLVGGGITWKVYHDKEQKKIETEALKKKNLEEEVKNAETEATNARIAATEASEEAEKAARKAAESKSEKDLEYAKKMKAEAESKQKLAIDKENEAAKYKEERDTALAEKKKAEQERDSAKAKAKQAEVDADKKKKELSKERDAANETAKQLLQDAFDENFPKLKTVFYPNKYYVETAKKLGYSVAEDKAKAKIESEFKKADNAGKKKIIDAIKTVLNKQNTDEATEKAKTETVKQAVKTDSVSKP